MRWHYKLIEKTPAFYRYAYSRESKLYDGELIYYIQSGKTEVVKPCAKDDMEIKTESARIHFQSVIEAEFPEQYSVSCG